MDPDRAAWSGGGELEPYSVLQVSRGATLEEVRHAYKAMALRTHPDKPGGDEKSFQEVVAAFEQISQLLSAQHSGSCPRGGVATAEDGPVSNWRQKNGGSLPADPGELSALLSALAGTQDFELVLRGLPPSRRRALLKHMEGNVGPNLPKPRRSKDAMAKQRAEYVASRFADSYGSATAANGVLSSW